MGSIQRERALSGVATLFGTVPTPLTVARSEIPSAVSPKIGNVGLLMTLTRSVTLPRMA